MAQVFREIALRWMSLNITSDKLKIGVGDGLVLSRHQAITRANGDYALWHHMTSPGTNELKHCEMTPHPATME